MIGISEVPYDWSNLSRQGVTSFPSSLSALVDPLIYPHVKVTVSLPSLLSDPRRRWIIGVPVTDVDLSSSTSSYRRPVNYPAVIFFIFPFLWLPERGRMSTFGNRINCGSLRQNLNSKGSGRILLSNSGKSMLHSTFICMISSGRSSSAFGNSVVGLPFTSRNAIPSRSSAFVAAPSTTLETVLASSYAATV